MKPQVLDEMHPVFFWFLKIQLIISTKARTVSVVYIIHYWTGVFSIRPQALSPITRADVSVNLIKLQKYTYGRHLMFFDNQNASVSWYHINVLILRRNRMKVHKTCLLIFFEESDRSLKEDDLLVCARVSTEQVQ